MVTIRYRYPRGHHRHTVLPGWQTTTAPPERVGMRLAWLDTMGVEVERTPEPAQAAQLRMFDVLGGGGR